MTVSRAHALRLASASERSLLESSFGRSLSHLSEARLKQKIPRARTLRDKYRDLAKRQRLEMRGKRRPSGRRAAAGNENTKLKADMFAEALERLQGALASSREAGESSRRGSARPKKGARGTKKAKSRLREAKPREGRRLAEEAPEPMRPGAAARRGARRSPWDSPRPGSAATSSSAASRGTRKAGKLQRAGVTRKQVHAGARGRRRQAARDAR